MKLRAIYGLAVLFIVFVTSLDSAAQLSEADFRRVLGERAAFSAGELAKLEDGEAVVKVLQSEKDEIAVIGVVSAGSGDRFSLESFRASLNQQNNQSMTAGKVFSQPPVIDDLVGLKLEDRDYRELKKCRPGKCDLNMTADAIRRLAIEVDWNAPDHRGAADNFVRRLLLQYAAGYLEKGDSSLEKYTNRATPFDPARAAGLLLSDAILLPEVSPGLRDHIRRFPEAELSGASGELRWSLIDFGLNPTIVLTHSIAYSETSGPAAQHFVVNKQFYASRYLDVSLSIAMLITAGDRTFIIFTDRSRTDALGGFFGKFARKLVVDEAINRTSQVIERSKAKLLAKSDPIPEVKTDELAGDSPESLLAKYRWPLIFGAVMVLSLLLFRIIRKRFG